MVFSWITLVPLVVPTRKMSTTVMSLSIIALILAVRLRLYSLVTFTYGIPTLCARLYGTLLLRKNHFSLVVSACIALSAVGLFNILPTGAGAWWYTLYWLAIPLCAYLFIRTGHLLFHALAVTFVAHAVGTLCYMLAGGGSLATWQMLSTIVWAERLCLATTATGINYFIRWAFSKSFFSFLSSHTRVST